MAKHKLDKLRIDVIGNWSEIKLAIIRDYAQAYSKILAAQDKPALEHVYIDAFAGAGYHYSKDSGDMVAGSPVNAAYADPPFKKYYFIDLDGGRVGNLKSMFDVRSDVQVLHGDCNEVLLKQVLPNVEYSQYRRGLAVLDPYGLDLSWKVIERCGRMRSIDMFLNFPIADMNRNVIWHNPSGVDEADVKRMNFYWGDETWKDVAYTEERTLFGVEPKKQPNEVIAEAFSLSS